MSANTVAEDFHRLGRVLTSYWQETSITMAEGKDWESMMNESIKTVSVCRIKKKQEGPPFGSPSLKNVII